MPTRNNTKRLELHKVITHIAYLRTTVSRVVISRALRPRPDRRDAAADAWSTPPVEGRTPAFNATVPAGPRATVTHRSRRAPEHDEEMPV
jgi:hypothetical protein